MHVAHLARAARSVTEVIDMLKPLFTLSLLLLSSLYLSESKIAHESPALCFLCEELLCIADRADVSPVIYYTE
jgi:hypothetical protein